jgi:hypothetical protein
MSSCSGITGAGDRCRAIAIGGSDWCHAHHPDRADVRRRSASKGGKRGGRGRPSVEISELKVQLSDLYAAVLDGTTEPKVGAVAAQIANVRARLVETELRVREVEELEAKLEEMAEAIERQKGGSTYGSTG